MDTVDLQMEVEKIGNDLIAIARHIEKSNYTDIRVVSIKLEKAKLEELVYMFDDYLLEKKKK